jgi:tetratricopeptide (TPR) repeat protein
MPASAGMTVESRPMHSYGVKDVEKLLRLPRSTIRALIAAGFVAPARGPRNSWRFSFQDLIVLRTAQALAAAKVPAKRITSSLKELRRQLPESMPLSGLSIGASGKHVVVRDGTGRRHVDSGQYLLGFESNAATGALSVIERAPERRPSTADEWMDRAAALEDEDPEKALKAYAQAVAADDARIDARINLGRLLHETGKLAQAEQVYRDALKGGGNDPVVLFNLGVLLEDTGRDAEALKSYDAALRHDAALADCHYNLSLLYSKLSKPRDALRHMAQYRRLTGREQR